MSTEAPVAPGAGVVAIPAAPAAPAAPSGVNEPWAKEWIQPDFTLNHKALDRLPDHLKGLRPVLERQKTFEDVLGVTQHAQFLAGKKGLAPLAADAPPEARTERKALLDTINGVPALAKDYGITKPADLPDQYWNAKLADGFTEWGHKNSVPPAAMKELVSRQLGAIKEQLTAQADYEKQFEATQNSQFEAQAKQANIAMDKAQELVEKGARSLGLDPENPNTKLLLRSADARLMAMRHALATGEDSFVQGKASDAPAADPSKLASDIQHNPANPLYAVYWNRENKYTRTDHEAAVAKVNELYRSGLSRGAKK